MNEEKLLKTLELFIPKCPAFNIYYSQEDLESYKTSYPNLNLNSIEETIKIDEKLNV